MELSRLVATVKAAEEYNELFNSCVTPYPPTRKLLFPSTQSVIANLLATLYRCSIPSF